VIVELIVGDDDPVERLLFCRDERTGRTVGGSGGGSDQDGVRRGHQARSVLFSSVMLHAHHPGGEFYELRLRLRVIINGRVIRSVMVPISSRGFQGKNQLPKEKWRRQFRL